MKIFLTIFFVVLLLIILKNSSQAQENTDKNDKYNIYSQYKINSLDPTPDSNRIGAYFPGFRGGNQLIIYTPKFGEYTGTNEFGKEAIVVKDRVYEFNGANSYIPRDGYVISGHGKAKTWIKQNLIEGAFIMINQDTMTLESVVNTESYLYQAQKRLKLVKKIIMEYKRTLSGYQYSHSRNYYNEALRHYQYGKFYNFEGNKEQAVKCFKSSLLLSEKALFNAVPAVRNEFRGVWLRPVEKNTDEISKTLDKLKNTGIDNVFLETYFQGYTIYPSYIMEKYGLTAQRPEFKGWDPFSEWIRLAHEKKMKIHVWFQAFYAGNEDLSANPKHILSVYPEWANVQKRNANAEKPMFSVSEHNGYFLDPANHMVRKFLLSLISEISINYDIDGINIDYIRYPKSLAIDFPGYMDSAWGYTAYARNDFKNQFGIDPIEIEKDNPLFQKWIEYRQNKVTEMVSQIKSVLVNKNTILSTVIFPNISDTMITKLQNWPEWSKNNYIDAYTPLIMSSDDNLAGESIKEIRNYVGQDIKIYPGLFEPFTSGSTIDFLTQIMSVRKNGASGIIIFDNAHLDEIYIKALNVRVFRE